MHKHREMYAMRRCDECSKSVSSLMWSRHKLVSPSAGGIEPAQRAVSERRLFAPRQQHCKSSCAPKSTQEKAAASHKAGLAARGRLSYTCYVCSRSFNASKYPGHVEACRVSFEKKDAVMLAVAVASCPPTGP